MAIRYIETGQFEPTDRRTYFLALELRLETHSPLMRYTRSTIALIYHMLRYTFSPSVMIGKWNARSFDNR